MARHARLVTIEEAEQMTRGVASACCEEPMVLRIERQTTDHVSIRLWTGDLAVFAACPRGLHNDPDASSFVYLGACIAG